VVFVATVVGVGGTSVKADTSEGRGSASTSSSEDSEVVSSEIEERSSGVYVNVVWEIERWGRRDFALRVEGVTIDSGSIR
jgi:hypothetical protein